MNNSEMVKALTEDPSKEFVCLGVVASVQNGNEIHFRKDGKMYGMCLGDSWKPVRKPVDFMTAVNSGKRIRPADDELSWLFNKPKDWLFILYNNVPKGWENYLNGLWEIE